MPPEQRRIQSAIPHQPETGQRFLSNPFCFPLYATAGRFARLLEVFPPEKLWPPCM